MKTLERWVARIGSVVIALPALWLGGCANPAGKGARWESVRKVDFKLAPQAQALAERARHTGNAFYPAVCALLADGRTEFPPQVDICLKKQLTGMHSGEARFTQICLDAHCLAQWQADPVAFDQVLVHEMAHVAQNYYRPIFGRWVMHISRPPACWREGMADYVCFKLGQTNGWRCAECDSMFPHYRDGYSCAGAFLLHVERAYDTNLVRQLNTVLQQGCYTDAFFRQRTGKDLDTLWAEFQRTPAFTPGAAQVLELQRSLGFVNGRPPKDVLRRLEQFLEQHVDQRRRKILNGAQLPGVASLDLQSRLALACYVTQPGGTAEDFLVGLKDGYALPGFAKGEKGTLSGSLTAKDLVVSYPATRSFTAIKKGDPSTYRYTASRASQDSAWELRRAWRTDKVGNVLEEFVLNPPPR